MKSIVVKSNEWNNEFISDILINKNRIIKCINIILTKENYSFDEVFRIYTYNSFEEWEEERCEMNEVVFTIGFPGIPNEISYVKYKEFFKLIENLVFQRIHLFDETEKEEILNSIEKARKVIEEEYS